MVGCRNRLAAGQHAIQLPRERDNEPPAVHRRGGHFGSRSWLSSTRARRLRSPPFWNRSLSPPSRGTSGSTGGPCSTVAGSTAWHACCASHPTPARPSGSRGEAWSATPGSGCRALLTKLGLTRSYVCLNAWAYAVHPSRAHAQQQHLDESAELAWRNELYD